MNKALEAITNFICPHKNNLGEGLSGWNTISQIPGITVLATA